MNYKTPFRDYLEESTKIPNEFNISISGSDYIIKREYHVRKPRGNMKFPRDAGLSMNKYKIIIEKSLPYMIKDDVYSITWSSNDKNNIISLNKSGVIIEVFGAIIKSTDHVDKLYVKAINRINLGNITFN